MAKNPQREEMLEMAKRCASANLRTAARIVTRHYDVYLAPAGITATQMPLLAAIEAGAAESIGALARALDLEQSTVSRDVATLQRRGLVVGANGGDRRARALTLAPAGRKVLRQAYALWRQAHEALEEACGPLDLSRLVSAARKTTKTLRQPGATPARPVRTALQRRSPAARAARLKREVRKREAQRLAGS